MTKHEYDTMKALMQGLESLFTVSMPMDETDTIDYVALNQRSRSAIADAKFLLAERSTF